jgi:hypothetical protein
MFVRLLLAMSPIEKRAMVNELNVLSALSVLSEPNALSDVAAEINVAVRVAKVVRKIVEVVNAPQTEALQNEALQNGPNHVTLNHVETKRRFMTSHSSKSMVTMM